MGNLITRYLAREIIKSSAATVLVLFIVLISNALGRVLADIADGEIPRAALGPVMLSQSVATLTLLLPIGMFLGIVFAFGRLYKDHEIVVMNACGVGYRTFYRPVLLVMLPVVALGAALSLWLNAAALDAARRIIDQAEQAHEFSQVKPGQFNQGSDGDRVFFMESISADRLELSDIILSESRGEQRIVETAERGRQTTAEASGDLFLELGPGQRMEGRAGEAAHRVISFERHGILLENRSRPAQRSVSLEQRSTARLWRSKGSRDRAELHWRIAIPVVLVVLTLLAVPLAYIAPRQGRFGKVGYALVVYIVYLNLMVVARAQLEAGKLPMAVNYWWVHALFVALTLVLLWRRNRGVLFTERAA